MAEQLGAAFREYVRRIAAGESLADDEFQRFSAYLDARERDGYTLLGRFAGSDPSLDTVSGRCGIRPPFRDLPA